MGIPIEKVFNSKPNKLAVILLITAHLKFHFNIKQDGGVDVLIFPFRIITHNALQTKIAIGCKHATEEYVDLFKISKSLN